MNPWVGCLQHTFAIFMFFFVSFLILRGALQRVCVAEIMRQLPQHSIKAVFNIIRGQGGVLQRGIVLPLANVLL